MKINILGYTLSVQRTELTPRQVELKAMEDSERESLINIDAQNNHISFLENVYDAYEEKELTEKMEQTKSSIEAAENTLIQWTVQLETVKLWYLNNIK